MRKRRSHLDGSIDAFRGGVRSLDEVNAQAGQGVDTVHGKVVSGRQVTPDHIDGGTRGTLEGAPADPRARMQTVVGLPRGAANWQGSEALFANSELPPTTPDGTGFRGSATIVSAADLDRVDRAHGTSREPVASPPAQTLEPGAYELRNGNVLLVNQAGDRREITREQFDRAVGAARRPPTLMQRAVGAALRRQ